MARTKAKSERTVTKATIKNKEQQHKHNNQEEENKQQAPMSYLPVIKTAKKVHDATDFGRTNSQDDIVEGDASRASANDGNASKRQLSGVAVGAGLVGLAVGGPLIGVVAAGGAAAVATSKGQAGEVARKGGDVVADAGKRLKEFNRKHKVTEKTSRGLIKGCEWVSEKLNKNSSANTSSSRQQ